MTRGSSLMNRDSLLMSCSSSLMNPNSPVMTGASSIMTRESSARIRKSSVMTRDSSLIHPDAWVMLQVRPEPCAVRSLVPEIKRTGEQGENHASAPDRHAMRFRHHAGRVSTGAADVRRLRSGVCAAQTTSASPDMAWQKHNVGAGRMDGDYLMSAELVVEHLLI